MAAADRPTADCLLEGVLKFEEEGDMEDIEVVEVVGDDRRLSFSDTWRLSEAAPGALLPGATAACCRTRYGHYQVQK